jgi:ATP-binding cassette subfamily C protein
MMPGSKSPTFEKVIQLDQISFAYGEKQVLREVSLSFAKGSITAIVGPSGSGKTTIVDLVTGLLKPQRGEILIDDQSLLKLDLRSWRKKIGYVPQENLLLHGTVLTNVTLGDPELSEADAVKALRAANAWEFVKSLPQGLNSSVGERGGNLSGGQRQRIAIARALVHKPKLLILDEATSGLDPESEVAVCNTLQKLRGELTILAISHQPALVNIADNSYRIKDGQIFQADNTSEPDRPPADIDSESGHKLQVVSSPGKSR